jgi:hypothetical protein
MPIWFELALLLVFTYAVGLGIGWLLWGRAAPLPAEPIAEPEGESAL